MKTRPLLALGLVAGLLIVAAGLAAYVYTGPARTLMEVREAIVEQDAARLEDLVDFPVLRDQVKAQILAQVVQDDPDAAAGAALGMALVGPMLDAMLTPQGVIAMTAQASEGQSGMPAQEWESRFKGNAETRFLSASRAELVFTDPGTPGGVALILERRGLSWRVVGGRVEVD